MKSSIIYFWNILRTCNNTFLIQYFLCLLCKVTIYVGKQISTWITKQIKYKNIHKINSIYNFTSNVKLFLKCKFVNILFSQAKLDTHAHVDLQIWTMKIWLHSECNTYTCTRINYSYGIFAMFYDDKTPVKYPAI